MEKLDIAEKEKVSGYLKEESDPEVKVKLISLNLVGCYSMSVRGVSEAMGIPACLWQTGKNNI